MINLYVRRETSGYSGWLLCGQTYVCVAELDLTQMYEYAQRKGYTILRICGG